MPPFSAIPPLRRINACRPSASALQMTAHSLKAMLSIVVKSRGVGLPHENLALAGNRRIPREASIGTSVLFIRKMESEIPEVPGVDTQKRGVVIAGVAKGRQQAKRRERN